MNRRGLLCRELARLQTKGADLSHDLAKARADAEKASMATSWKRSDGSRSKSPSTQKSAISAARREEKRAVDTRR